MNLMSTLRFLLWFVLATRVLGISSVRHSEIRVNNTLTFHQKQLTNKKLLLNVNGPPLVNMVTELQSVFRDITCRYCTTCMERAIKAHRVQSHVISNRPNAHELYYEVLNNRRKRSTSVLQNDLERKIVIGKSFSAMVTKHIKDKKVFAIEVRETNENGKANTCKVYSVKKSHPCDLGSDLISKRKINKKNKKIKDKNPVTVTTEKMKSISPSYKKREVDNSEVPESFMPSIEEMY